MIMNKKKLSKKVVMEFFKENKWVFIKIGILMLPTAVGFANDAANIEITPLQTPMTKIVKFVSGPMAGTVTIVSGITALVSHQLGGEQNVTKKALGVAGCGGLATQVDTVASSLGITASSCMFF